MFAGDPAGRRAAENPPGPGGATAPTDRVAALLNAMELLPTSRAMSESWTVPTCMTPKMARRAPGLVERHRLLADPELPPADRLALVETDMRGLDRATGYPDAYLLDHLLHCTLGAAAGVVGDDRATFGQAVQAADAAVLIISLTRSIDAGGGIEIPGSEHWPVALAPLLGPGPFAHINEVERVLDAAWLGRRDGPQF